MSNKHFKSYEPTPEFARFQSALMAIAGKLTEYGIGLKEVVVDRIPRVYVDRSNEDSTITFLSPVGELVVRQEHTPEGMLR